MAKSRAITFEEFLKYYYDMLWEDYERLNDYEQRKISLEYKELSKYVIK